MNSIVKKKLSKKEYLNFTFALLLAVSKRLLLFETSLFYVKLDVPLVYDFQIILYGIKLI